MPNHSVSYPSSYSNNSEHLSDRIDSDSVRSNESQSDEEMPPMREDPMQSHEMSFSRVDLTGFDVEERIGSSFATKGYQYLTGSRSKMAR